MLTDHTVTTIMTPRRNPKGHSLARVLFRLFLVVGLVAFILWPINDVVADSVSQFTSDGPESLAEGKKLYEEGDYDQAALFYWRAVLLQANTPPGKYTVEEAFQGFLGCYSVRGRTVDGFLFIAKEVMARKQKDMALQYIDQALA